MKCSEIKNLLSAYHDGELAPDLRERAGKHLADCPACTAELAQFQSLTLLANDLEQLETPHSVWANVEQSLRKTPDNANRETLPGERRPPNAYRPIIQLVLAVAATLTVGLIGWSIWADGHEHREMLAAMEQVASDIDSDSVTNLLLEKYGGSEVSYLDAITQVGYRPVASKSLPDGYLVDSIQVLDMPCCRCTQTACLRPDKTRFFIYEHQNEETGWFHQRKQRQSECCGKTCQIVELDNQLVVTWKKGNRHITMVGVRNEQEIELLVSQFETDS